MRIFSLVAVLAIAGGVCVQAAPITPTINVYVSGPGVQSTFVPGAATETFDALASGNRSTPYSSAIGTYQLNGASQFNIGGANQYGGANGTPFMAFGAQSGTSAPVGIQLPGLQSYFGFWWSAGDALNGISFYYDNTLLTRFLTGDITQLLRRDTNVTAVNGTIYAANDYYGNPNAPLGRNTSEPYAYVHFIADGIKFNRIVLDNSGSTGTGFESDNHSIFANRVQPDGGTVLVRQIETAAVPEPGTYALLGAGLAGMAALGRRRRSLR